MKIHYFKQTLFPCVFLSALTGVFTGVLIFIFKYLSKLVIGLSSDIYVMVQAQPKYIILLICGASIVGLISFMVISCIPGCRGGGIPTAVAILRGHIKFNWLTNLIGMFTSSIITFAMGVPLGNEGPSVQMGCAVGRGTVNGFAKKNKAWDRYIMTGGASAGFACATGAPLSAMLFAFEEVHRRFSPIVFMSACSAILTSYSVTSALCELFGMDMGVFDFYIDYAIGVKYVWCAIFVGAVSGLAAVFFAKAYRITDKLMNYIMSNVPNELKIIFVFIAVAVLGYFSLDFTGSGHDIICEIMNGEAPAWYLLTIYLLVRVLLLLLANTAGITGGIFVPSLAFGAMIGSLCSKLMVYTNVLPQKYTPVFVIVGMTAFLAASSKIPLTAVAFSLETLSGISNVLPISIGAAVAYIVVEAAGAVSLTDSVIEGKLQVQSRENKTVVIDTKMMVSSGSFAQGKEIRDLLLPPNCVIVSMEKESSDTMLLSQGDILHFRCKTYDKEETINYLEQLFGIQQEHLSRVLSVHEGEEHYALPEI